MVQQENNGCINIKNSEVTLNCNDCPCNKKKNNFMEIAVRISNLVSEKNKNYGNSFEKCSDFLKILYPKGIKTKEYGDLLTIVRIFDKIMRISQGAIEDSWEDILGYALLSIEREERNNENK